MVEPTPEQRPDDSLPENAPSVFQQAAEERELGLFAEFVDFLKESGAWWLTPILIVLAIVCVLVALSSTVVAPFIYPIF